MYGEESADLVEVAVTKKVVVGRMGWWSRK